MPTTTVYSSTDDGTVYGSNATYATARSTAAGALTSTGAIGQDGPGTYNCYEYLCDFDVSGVPNVANASAVTFALYVTGDSSATDFTATAANIADYGTLATGDWVAGASLSGLTTAATLATSGVSVSAYNNFTNSGTVLLDDVKAAGNTSMLCYSSRHSGNNTPTGVERIDFSTTEASGTSQDPKLTITTPATGGFPTGNPFSHILVR